MKTGIIIYFVFMSISISFFIMFMVIDIFKEIKSVMKQKVLSDFKGFEKDV